MLLLVFPLIYDSHKPTQGIDMDQETLHFIKRLEKHPNLRARMEAILEVAENTREEFATADAAELQLIKEVRTLGAETLESWAANREKTNTQSYKREHASATCHGKKK